MNAHSKITSFTGPSRFLSNFFECTVHYDGIEFPSAEHAYQAAKSNDIRVMTRIASLKTPGEAKRVGRKILIQKNWENIRADVMYSIVQNKFFNNAVLGAKLMATSPAQLIEGNEWGDTFWGVCDDTGENNLGKILMKVRTELFADLHFVE